MGLGEREESVWAGRAGGPAGQENSSDKPKGQGRGSDQTGRFTVHSGGQNREGQWVQPQEKHRGLGVSWSQGFLTSEFLDLRVVGEAEGTENPGQSPGQPDAKPAP